MEFIHENFYPIFTPKSNTPYVGNYGRIVLFLFPKNGCKFLNSVFIIFQNFKKVYVRGKKKKVNERKGDTSCIIKIILERSLEYNEYQRQISHHLYLRLKTNNLSAE